MPNAPDRITMFVNREIVASTDQLHVWAELKQDVERPRHVWLALGGHDLRSVSTRDNGVEFEANGIEAIHALIKLLTSLADRAATTFEHTTPGV